MGCKPTLVQGLCFLHFALMLTMLTFGGLLLKEVFYCDACLWFAVGTQHASEVSSATTIGQANKTAELSVKGYTGTVQNALNLNSATGVTEDALGDNCGVWVLHPNHWKVQPGKQIEFDTTVGETPIAVGGALGAAGDGSVRAKPLSDAHSESSCKVSLGDDGRLRNWASNNEVITDGNCNKVQWIDETQDAGSLLNARDADDAILNRNHFGIIGGAIFFLMRMAQYINTVQALGSESLPSYAESCIDKSIEKVLKYCGHKGLISILFAIFEWVFYSQIPALVLEPITGINFLDHCSAVLTVRFSPQVWLAAVACGSVGLVFHVADILFDGLCDKKKKKKRFWELIMFVVGFALTAFVAYIKVIQILRYGFSMVFNIKAEWAFTFEFWPLNLAVSVDMLQVASFLFFTYDLYFSGVLVYYKYFANESDRRKQAGWFGKMVRVKDDTNVQAARNMRNYFDEECPEEEMSQYCGEALKQECNQIFDDCDKNGDGKLKFKELRHAVENKASKEVMRTCMAGFDDTGDSVLDRDEFFEFYKLITFMNNQEAKLQGAAV